MSLETQQIAVIGGTGALGGGLARRWSAAGLSIMIGSRDPEKAAEFARSLPQQAKGRPAAGLSNREAAERATIIVLTVPFATQAGATETMDANATDLSAQ